MQPQNVVDDLGVRSLQAEVDQSATVSYTDRMNVGTWLFTLLHGRRVGSDADGNVYYEERRGRRGFRVRRWVAYAGAPEASKVPAEWHAWLHYTVDQPLQPADDKPWVKDHSANMSGTSAAYLPAGHDLRGGERAKATGDYEAWQP